MTSTNENMGEGDEFEVEKIISSRTRKGKPIFLVRWKGYDSTDDTWEPLDNLQHCQDMIYQFVKTNETPSTVRKYFKKEMEQEDKKPENDYRPTILPKVLNVDTKEDSYETKQETNIFEANTHEPWSTPNRMKTLSPQRFKDTYGRYPNIDEIKENVKKRSIAKAKGESTPELVLHTHDSSFSTIITHRQFKFVILYMIFAAIFIIIIFYVVPRIFAQIES